METVPGEEPTRELTKSEAGTLEEKKAEDNRAIDEVHAPFEDEADRIRANALESRHHQELESVDSHQRKLLDALVAERNQPITDEHLRLETIRLDQLKAERRSVKHPRTNSRKINPSSG